MPKGSWREYEDLASNKKADLPQNFSPKADRLVRVERTRGGKGGKTVTIIRGLGLNPIDSRNLLKKLKVKCGTGGTVKEENIELQGDQIMASIEVLEKEGFCPKQSGG